MVLVFSPILTIQYPDKSYTPINNGVRDETYYLRRDRWYRSACPRAGGGRRARGHRSRTRSKETAGAGAPKGAHRNGRPGGSGLGRAKVRGRGRRRCPLRPGSAVAFRGGDYLAGGTGE